MKKAIIAATVATVMSVSAHADTVLGLYIGGSVWDTESSGTFRDETSGGVDADFNLTDNKNNSFYVALEHPIPLIPNIKVASTELTTDGSTTANFTFDDVDYTGNISTELDLSFVDYIFYYEVFDNDLFSFDMGLTARKFDGDILVSNDTDSSKVDISQVVPMLYVSTVIGLPFTGFNLFAEGNLLSIDDSTIYDYKAGVSYAVLDNMAVDLNIDLGYRAAVMELEDVDDIYSDLEFKGLFLGATVHF